MVPPWTPDLLSIAGPSWTLIVVHDGAIMDTQPIYPWWWSRLFFKFNCCFHIPTCFHLFCDPVKLALCDLTLQVSLSSGHEKTGTYLSIREIKYGHPSIKHSTRTNIPVGVFPRRCRIGGVLVYWGFVPKICLSLLRRTEWHKRERENWWSTRLDTGFRSRRRGHVVHADLPDLRGFYMNRMAEVQREWRIHRYIILSYHAAANQPLSQFKESSNMFLGHQNCATYMKRSKKHRKCTKKNFHKKTTAEIASRTYRVIQRRPHQMK